MRFTKNGAHNLMCVMSKEELQERYKVKCKDSFEPEELAPVLTDVLKIAFSQGLIKAGESTVGVKTTVLNDSSLEILFSFQKDMASFKKHFDSLESPIKRIGNLGLNDFGEDLPDRDGDLAYAYGDEDYNDCDSEYEDFDSYDDTKGYEFLDDLDDYDDFADIPDEVLDGTLKAELFNQDTPDSIIQRVSSVFMNRFPILFDIPLELDAIISLSTAAFLFIRDWASNDEKTIDTYFDIMREISDKFFDSPRNRRIDLLIRMVRPGVSDSLMIKEYDHYLSCRAKYLEQYGYNRLYWAELPDMNRCIEFAKMAKASGMAGKSLYKDTDGTYYMMILSPTDKDTENASYMLTLCEFADIYQPSGFEADTLFEHGTCIIKDDAVDMLVGCDD